MAARTLFNDSHNEPVAHVYNYFKKPYRIKADSFLGLAEPVVHIDGTSSKVVESSLTNGELSVLNQPDVSSLPESSDLQLDPVPDSMAGLRTLTLSVTPMAKDAGPSQQGAYVKIP